MLEGVPETLVIYAYQGVYSSLSAFQALFHYPCRA